MFYKANEKYNSNLSAGYTAGQTTLSVAETPDNVPTIVTVGFGTDKETTFIAEGKSLGTLTGITRLRGYNGNIDANTAITCLNNEEFINQVENVVSTPETLIPIVYAIDGGSNDTYAISLDVPPSAYVAGMMIAFKANTSNTGACTLNVNTLGAKSIKKAGNVDLGDGDILSGQVVWVIYDGTNFQLIQYADGGIVTDSDGATITFDRAVGKTHQVVLGGNRTLAIDHLGVGQYIAIDLIQDATGSRTVTWWSTIKWADGVAPTLTTTANKIDSFIIKCTGSGTYNGYVVSQNL